MMKINRKQVLIVFIVSFLVIGFIFLNRKTESISTQTSTIVSKETQYFQGDNNFKKISVKYSIKDSNDNNIKINIYDPEGNLEDSGIISSDNIYEKKIDNKKGEWKVELTPTNNNETIVESIISRSEK